MPIKMVKALNKTTGKVPSQVPGQTAKTAKPVKPIKLKTKQIAAKNPALEAASEALLEKQVEQAVKVQSTALILNQNEVTLTLRLTQETNAYLGVTLPGDDVKVYWLAKDSLIRFSIKGEGESREARVTMTKQQAVRRKLLAHAEMVAA